MHEPVARAFVPWEALAAPGAHTLDPPIRPLVEALNRTIWARTVFSCAGHPEEPNSVENGRRQAHIDLLISDQPRYRTFVAATRKAVHGARVVEGSLGPVPAWLLPHLPPPLGTPEESARGPGEQPSTGAAGAQGVRGWREGQSSTCGVGAQGVRGWRAGRSVPSGSRAAPWLYRRLVFEPIPYTLPAPQCRAILDAALTAALTALTTPTL